MTSAELAAPALSHPLYTLIALSAAIVGYRLLCQTLRSLPGPWLTFISLPLYYHTYIGDECTWIDSLHVRYGPVLRIAPNGVSITDGAALGPIYLEKGGFKKSQCYHNYDIDGYHTMFSATDSAYRAVRAKSVMPMFAIATLRSKAVPVLESVVARFVEYIRAGAASGRSVDLIIPTRALALDAVTEYLFGRSYNGLEEPELKDAGLSASGFVDMSVAVGRLFLLPHNLNLVLAKLVSWIFPDKRGKDSTQIMQNFVTSAIDAAVETDDTWQARMLRAGIQKPDVGVQMTDAIFAGTDTMSTVLVTIIFLLARNKEQYERLHSEVTSNPDEDPQALPYLRGVVREALRLSRVNSTRFCREVPAGGWTFGGYHLPAGTNVGVQNFSLHRGPSYTDPARFAPERWLDASPDMLRDYTPFGLGVRTCIAQNFGIVTLCITVRRLVESDLLRHAAPVQGEIKLREWFSARIEGGRIDLIWEPGAKL